MEHPDEIGEDTIMGRRLEMLQEIHQEVNPGGRPKKFEKPIHFSISFESDDHKRLKYYSKKTGISIADIIREITLKHLDLDILDLFAKYKFNTKEGSHSL